MVIKDFGDGFVLKEIDQKELKAIQDKHFEKAFSNRANPSQNWPISTDHQEKIKSRNHEVWNLKVGLYHNDEAIGWHYGFAFNPETYYMQNSAVINEYQGKGLYSKMLKEVIRHLGENGFQVITSLHHPNNPGVIIPKLKNGFVISGMVVHERFRTLIEMKYYFDPARRRSFDQQIGLDISAE